LDFFFDVVNLLAYYQLPCIGEIQSGAYGNTPYGLWGIETQYPSIAEKSNNQNPQEI